MAHIVDSVLCIDAGDDEADVSHSNRLAMRVDLHALYDQRRFAICPNTGEVVSSLTKEERVSLGLPPTSTVFIDKGLLTEERRAYLDRRVNNYSSFQTLKALALRRKAKARTDGGGVSSGGGGARGGAPRDFQVSGKSQ